jgi:hypothetical protein
VIRESAHQALEDLRGVIGVPRGEAAGDRCVDGVPKQPQPTLVDLPELVDAERFIDTHGAASLLWRSLQEC